MKPGNVIIFFLLASLGAAFFFRKKNAYASVESNVSWLPGERFMNDLVLPLGVRNNNPGNIKWNALNNWVGQMGKDSQGHIIFDTIENGIRAMNITLRNYRKSGRNTIRKVIQGDGLRAGWAEGNQAPYIKYLSSRMEKPSDEVLTDSDQRALIEGIIGFENRNYSYPESVITKAMSL